MKRARSLAAMIAVLALAGCGSSSSSSSSTAAASTTQAAPSSTAATNGPTAGGTVMVTIKSLAFNPSTINAKVGQTVQWVNEDQPPHNVVYVSGPMFASSSTLNTGAKFQIKLTAPGTIRYFCSIHPFMKATIVVSK